MILNEEFMKIYEELESINGEEPADEVDSINLKLTESSVIPQVKLREVIHYIKTVHKWDARSVEVDDEGEVSIEFNTTRGSNPFDEKVINDIGEYAYDYDLNFAIDTDPEGKNEIVKVYLDLVTI